jgi:hypothetical protein
MSLLWASTCKMNSASDYPSFLTKVMKEALSWAEESPNSA